MGLSEEQLVYLFTETSLMAFGIDLLCTGTYAKTDHHHFAYHRAMARNIYVSDLLYPILLLYVNAGLR